MTTKELDNLYIANTYARFPLCLKEGKGSLVRDDRGNEYIDLGTGIAVNTFGYCDDAWISAVESQLHSIQHTSNLYYNEPSAKLAQLLCAKTGMKKVFFSNSGAEANECAIKAARKYGEAVKGSEYTTIITLKDSFHGRTITTLAATGQDTFHKDFLPLTSGFVHAKANDIEDVKHLAAQNKCCAVMIETVQGEGGVLPLDKDFVKELEEFCHSQELLLVVDEVQTGNGRTGRLYGYMNFDVSPDIVTTAKGLAGGLPIGATLLGEKVENLFTPGMHGSTFGGNPISAAAALSVISRIDDELLAKVRMKSEYIFSTLRGACGIVSVTGMGLMIGIEVEGNRANEIIEECRRNGVLVIKAKNKIRLLPALNIDFEILKKAISVILEACKK